MALAARIHAAGQFDAWLCDLDGTLADTMSLHWAAYAKVLRRYGGHLSRRQFDAIVGPPAHITIPLFIQASGIDRIGTEFANQIHAEKKTVFNTLIAAGKIMPLEAARLVQNISPHIRVSVVTSGNGQGAAAVLQAIGLTKRVEFIISGDDVKRGKPDPEPYLLAASRLGITPDRCLVLEDHCDGINAALAAGMAVLDVNEREVTTGC